MWNQTSKEQILDVNSVQFTIFIKSSQYCSKCNPNLASKEKKYSKSKTVLQYSNKKKSAGEPKETSASHSHFWQSFLNIFTPRNASYAQRKHRHPSDPRTSGRRWVEIEGAVRNHQQAAYFYMKTGGCGWSQEAVQEQSTWSGPLTLWRRPELSHRGMSSPTTVKPRETNQETSRNGIKRGISHTW